MKKIILMLVLFASVSAWTQTTPNQTTSPQLPPGPAAPTAPGLPASPVNSGLPASPVNPGLPGFTNAFGASGVSNQFTTNGLPADLSPLLANLQANMEQLLPALAAFNDNLAFAGLGTGTGGFSGQTGIVSTTGQNLGRNFGVNASTAPQSANLGANFSTVTGGSTPTTPATSSSAASPFVGTGPQAATTSAGTAPTGSGFGGTNNFFATAAMRNSLRALVVLQNDIERMLPLVAGLNGGSVGVLPGVNATNSLAFGLGTTNTTGVRPGPVVTPSATRTGALTPTGR